MTYISLLLASLSLAIAIPANAAQNTALIPLTNSKDLRGWEAVGRIDVARSGYCTGVLIANDLVLTAAHCIFDSRTGEQLAPKNFVFKAGLFNGKSVKSVQGRNIVVDRAYNPRHGTSQENIRHDVALIQLATPITTIAAVPFKLHSGATKGRQISVLSYGQGRDNALSWQRACTVLAREKGLMAFDCNVTHGSSGAPVFVREGNRNRILSLISSGGKSGKGVISFGMELPKIVAQLKKDLANATVLKPKKFGVRIMSVGDGKSTSGAKFIKN